MDIGKEEGTKRIELPARETAPERRKIERTEPAETPTKDPVKTPAKESV